MTEQTTVGIRLKDARESRGLTLKQLGVKTGLSPSYLSLVENDKRAPSEAAIKLLCAALDESEDWLTTGRGASKSTGIPRGPIAHLPAELDPVMRAGIEAHLVNQVALFERMTQEMTELRRLVMELRTRAASEEEIQRDLRATEALAEKIVPIQRPVKPVKPDHRRAGPAR